MLLEELIEKAFSDGYEYALEEREFANIRQATKIAKRTAKEAFNNYGLPEKVGRRTTQLQRLGYKLPTEKALDRVSSVTTNTLVKHAKKHNIPLSLDKKSIKELTKNSSMETAQKVHDLSTQRGFRTRKIGEI